MSEQEFVAPAQENSSEPSQRRGAESSPAPVKSQRKVQFLIAGITVATLLLVGGIAFLGGSKIPLAEAADIPTGIVDPWSRESDANAEEFASEWVREMNEALQAHDREAFLKNAEGEGRAALERWWDGTTAIGWEYAYAYQVGIDGLVLGSKLGFASHPLRFSGSPDAGLDLTQQFRYDMVLDSEDADDATIVSLTPQHSMPWDEGEIHVVKRDHVIVYGRADERDLIDRNADTAEEAAIIAFQTLENIGGTAPTSGFNMMITDSEDRFNGWMNNAFEDSEMHPAAVAQSTMRPAYPEPFMPESTATGPYSSGSWILMGPASASNVQAVMVHEMAHVLHEAALPYPDGAFYQANYVEGFASYFTSAAGVTPPPLEYRNGYEKALTLGYSATTNEELTGADAGKSYGVAGSMYQYVAENGGSAWELAMARDNSFMLEFAMRAQDKSFTEENWRAWVATQ